MAAVRVRFAPSPTGYLHVGGARTALFNWLYARHTGGTFVLRIEDTDRERSTDAHTQVILDGLSWLGVSWDEGPLFQGSFGDRHRADAMRLVEGGLAYRCFCSKEELERQRSAAGPGNFRYNGHCRSLDPAQSAAQAAAGEPATIRLVMPDTELAWADAVHGRISFQGHDLDDIVILRSDGSPIYNLAVVSDDIAMEISHVIRGDDHISNTPKQLAIYRALGAVEPVFAHVPMILGADGKKLSKRHGATAVGDYREQGIFPAAMRNFLALLGWSPGEDREILPESELISLFSLEHIQSKPAVFDTAKLEWMNGQYLSATPAAGLRAAVEQELATRGLVAPPDRLAALIDGVKIRSRTIVQLAEQIAVRLEGPDGSVDSKAAQFRQKLGTGYRDNLSLALRALADIDEAGWTPEALLERIKTAAAEASLKLGDVMQPIRIALTGATVSEPVNELLWLVGRDAALTRLRHAAEDAAQ